MRWLLLIALVSGSAAAGCNRAERARADQAAVADVNLIVALDPAMMKKHDVTREQVLGALQKSSVAVRKTIERAEAIELLTHAPAGLDMSELLKSPLKDGVELGHLASLHGRPLAK